jgi:hypothetical protein
MTFLLLLCLVLYVVAFRDTSDRSKDVVEKHWFIWSVIIAALCSRKC